MFCGRTGAVQQQMVPLLRHRRFEDCSGSKGRLKICNTFALMSIEVKNLTKVYGEQKAIDHISFTVNRGEIVGFLGPNGAGKSTTMKIITGYLQPDEGDAFVSGVDVKKEPLKAKSKIGYLPEANPLYYDM